MENIKAKAIMTKYEDLIPRKRAAQLKNALHNANDNIYDIVMGVKTKSPTITLILAIFLGGLGIDRFYNGDIGLGFLKFFINGLTFGILWIVDIFLSYRSTKEKNFIKLMSVLS